MDTDLIDRLVDRIMLMPDGCWQWTGSLVQKGYGQIKQGGKGLRAHRVSYEFFVGPIPEGLTLDHLCRNRGCVNPEHLEPTTQRVNILRGENNAAKNARKTHCPKGHEYDYDYPGRHKRMCRTCHNELQRALYHKKKAGNGASPFPA